MASHTPIPATAPVAPDSRAWRLASAAGAAMVALHVTLWLVLDDAHARRVLNGVMSVLTFCASSSLLAWAARRSRVRQPAAARTWTGFAVMHAALLVPNAWWLTVATVPALAHRPLTAFDASFAVVVPALFYGMATLPTARSSGGIRLAAALDILMVALASAVLAWNVGLAVTGEPSAPGGWAALGEIAFATLGFGLIAVMLFRPMDGQTRAPLLWFAGGMAVAVVDVVAYALWAPDGSYDNGGPTVLCMVAGAWAMGLGGARQVRSCAETTQPIAELPASVLRVGRWLPAALVAVASALAFSVPTLPMPHRQLELVVVTMATLLMARQVLALRQIDTLNGALRTLNSELETRIEARTADLIRVNVELVAQIQERQRVERVLLERERRLAEMASRDGLTGLLNRSFFLERLQEVLHAARRAGAAHHAVLFLDLDSFKLINDSLGHRIGDLMLIEIAHRLQSAVRASDVVARLGGDEFVVLLGEVEDEAAAEHAALRIQAALTAPLVVEGHPMHCSASIGVVMGRVSDVDVTEVVRDADLAMYHAKTHGKGRHAIYTVEMHTAVLTRMHMETDLRLALDRGEFSVEYQPIYCLERERISGFEALIRWTHPERGRIPPSVFIPVAESTALILPIGQWVLGEACRQMARWRDSVPEAADVTISVNLSARQFNQPDLAPLVAAALADSGLPPAALKVEITESAIIDDADRAQEVFASLRAMGVQVQLDDFGIGYSSLSYLHRFPIDALKIDRSFVSRVHTEGENAEIVGTIVGLAHALGLTVTAEGVETPEQLARLRELRCEYVQGYLIARPMPPDAVPGALVRPRPTVERPPAAAELT